MYTVYGWAIYFIMPLISSHLLHLSRCERWSTLMVQLFKSNLVTHFSRGQIYQRDYYTRYSLCDFWRIFLVEDPTLDYVIVNLHFITAWMHLSFLWIQIHPKHIIICMTLDLFEQKYILRNFCIQWSFFLNNL